MEDIIEELLGEEIHDETDEHPIGNVKHELKIIVDFAYSTSLQLSFRY